MNNLSSYIAEHNKTHIIFDFDETLFYLLLPWERCFESIEELLKKTDSELFSSYKKSLSWSKLQNRYVEKYGEKLLSEIIKNNTYFETQLLKGYEINKELLDEIKNLQVKEMSIWSSNTREVIEGILTKNNIKNLFSHIITRSDVKFLKPHNEGFLKIYQSSIPRQQYLMVGDSTADSEAAKAVGIDFYEIRYF